VLITLILAVPFAVSASSNSNIGDFNGDGAVDASDASEVLTLYSAISTGEISEPTAQELKDGDVTHDGVIDAADASDILGYYAYVQTKKSPSPNSFYFETDNFNIITEPRTVYTVGETFNPSDISMAYEAIETCGGVPPAWYDVICPSLDTPGIKTVTIEWGKHVASYEITVVVAETVTSLSLRNDGDDLSLEQWFYFVGESYNSKGVILDVLYNTGRKESITSGFTVKHEPFKTKGWYTVTFSYKGASTEIEVSVQEHYKPLTLSQSLTKGMTTAQLNEVKSLVKELINFDGVERYDDWLRVYFAFNMVNYVFENFCVESRTGHYADAYGVFFENSCSSAGVTRAVGFMLYSMGINYQHINENKNADQYCRVQIDGEWWIVDAYNGIFELE